MVEVDLEANNWMESVGYAATNGRESAELASGLDATVQHCFAQRYILQMTASLVIPTCIRAYTLQHGAARMDIALLVRGLCSAHGDGEFSQLFSAFGPRRAPFFHG